MKVDMERHTVLVVDDEKGIRDTLEKSLRKENYRVLVASDGREALDVINHDSVDVVITDLKMAGIDGLTFLRAVKQIHPEIEVVVMTGYGTIDTAVEAIKEGAYDFIQKPFKKITIKVLSRSFSLYGLADYKLCFLSHNP